jgi:hypothetical protein
MSSEIENLRSENSALRAELRECQAALAYSRQQADAEHEKQAQARRALEAKIERLEFRNYESEARHDRELMKERHDTMFGRGMF